MVYKESADGQIRFVISHAELRRYLAIWRNKPETKAMLERMAAERRAFVDSVLAEAKAKQK